jgi:hypothetical protein
MQNTSLKLLGIENKISYLGYAFSWVLNWFPIISAAVLWGTGFKKFENCWPQTCGALSAYSFHVLMAWFLGTWASLPVSLYPSLNNLMIPINELELPLGLNVGCDINEETACYYYYFEP